MLEDKQVLIVDPIDSVYTDQLRFKEFTCDVKTIEIETSVAQQHTSENQGVYEVDFISIQLTDPRRVMVKEQQDTHCVSVVISSEQGLSHVLSNNPKDVAKVMEDYIQVKGKMQDTERVQVASLKKDSDFIITNDFQQSSFLPSTTSSQQDPPMQLVQAIENIGMNEEIDESQLYEAPILLDIVPEQEKEQAIIEFLFDTTFKYSSDYKKDPHRLVLDPESYMFTDLDKDNPYDMGFVQKITIVPKELTLPLGLDESFYGVDRVIIELSEDVTYDIKEDADEGTIVVIMQSSVKETTAMVPAEKEPADIPLEEVEKELFEEEFEESQEFREEAIEPELELPEKTIVGGPVLLDIGVDNQMNIASVMIHADGVFQYTEYQLENPFRIVIDPLLPMYTDMDKTQYFRTGIIQSIKILPQNIERPTGLDSSYYGVDALVLELRTSGAYVIERKGANLLLHVEGEKRAVKQPRGVVPQMPVAKHEPADIEVMKGKTVTDLLRAKPPVEVPLHPLGHLPNISKVKKAWKNFRGFSLNGKTLEECVQIGFLNNRQIRVALEEIKLSKMKVFEAKRGMYPNLKVRTTLTTGRTSGTKFRERRFGLEAEQPIYYSRRLVNTYKQAKLNLHVATKKLDKLQLDVSQKVTEAFNNLQKSYANYQQHYSLVKRGEYVLKLTKTLYEKGMITELEFLNVQSQMYQILYQIESARRDVELTRLKFHKELAFSYDNEMIDVRPQFTFKQIDIYLEEAIELAYGHRPDILINNVLIQVHHLGEKIAKAKESWQVSVSGFAGKSGSAYQTEKLKLKKDYTVGFKVKKGFRGNNLDYSLSKNKTAPKLGQNERTNSTSHEITWGVLDGLGGRNDIQKARIEFLKALDDKMNLDATVRVEVRESYYNYKKALIQLENISNKIKIKLKELRVTRLQSAYHEVPQSKLLESYIRLSEEFTQYNDTLNNYKNAINSLNKAVGIAQHYQS